MRDVGLVELSQRPYVPHLSGLASVSCFGGLDFDDDRVSLDKYANVSVQYRIR